MGGWAGGRWGATTLRGGSARRWRQGGVCVVWAVGSRATSRLATAAAVSAGCCWSAFGGAAPGELSAAVRPLARRHTPRDVDGVGAWVREGRVGCRLSLGVAALTHSPPRRAVWPFAASRREVGSGRDWRVHPPPRRCRQRHAPPLPSTSASTNLGGASHTVRGPLTGRCNPPTPPSRAAAAARGGAGPGTVDRRGRGCRAPQWLWAGGRVFKQGTAHHRHDASSTTYLALLLCGIDGESVVLWSLLPHPSLPPRRPSVASTHPSPPLTSPSHHLETRPWLAHEAW